MKRFTLIYKNNKEDLKILDRVFVRNNKLKSKIIYKNKILSLTDKFQNLDNKEKILKIGLLILDTNGLNLKKMLYDCKSLVKILDKLQERVDINNILDNELLQNNIQDNSIINTYNLFSLYLLLSSNESYNIKVNNLSFLFHGCSSLVSLPDLSLWDTKLFYLKYLL